MFRKRIKVSLKRQKIMEKVVAVINNLNPAFVVITGDMVNDGEDQNQINEFKRICTLIKKKHPCLCVTR